MVPHVTTITIYVHIYTYLFLVSYSEAQFPGPSLRQLSARDSTENYKLIGQGNWFSLYLVVKKYPVSFIWECLLFAACFSLLLYQNVIGGIDDRGFTISQQPGKGFGGYNPGNRWFQPKGIIL